MRAVGEKLFSEPGCLRETVLEKPFSERPFYELQPRSFPGRSCSTRSGSVGGRSERSGSAKAVASKERFLTARAPNPEGATPTFSTRIENQDHADGLPDFSL